MGLVGEQLFLVGKQVVKVVASVILTSQGQLLRLLGISIIIIFVVIVVVVAVVVVVVVVFLVVVITISSTFNAIKYLLSNDDISDQQ